MQTSVSRDDAVDMGRESSVVRTVGQSSTMSARILGLDWTTVLPWIIEGVRVEAVPFDVALPFLNAHGAELFGAGNDSFLHEPMSSTKLRFCAEMDTFLLYSDDRPIGYWAGHPTDWTTYYARSMAILPDFRQTRIASELSSRIVQVLTDQTEIRRLDVDTSVANIAMTKLLLGLGFITTSTFASERWGLTVRFTLFMDTQAKAVFARQFVNVPELGKLRGK